MSARVRLGVIGRPIAHSLSPVMHRAALDALGLRDVSYEAIEVAPEDLGASLERLAREGFVGLNVTLPHKTAVLAHLAGVDDVARALGAANTLVRTPEGWVGSNTDVLGLARSLEEGGVRVAGLRAVVLGAGGAARASLLALSGARERVVVARRLEAAREVASLAPGAQAATFDEIADVLSGAELLVQATSATLGPDAVSFASRLPLERVASGAVVVDLVYRPRETALLARARAAGLRVIDGTGMLVHQGAASLERWLGARAPVEIMRAAVIGALAD